MSWKDILGIVSTIALFIPVIFIFALRLFTHRSFIALLLYYALAGLCNLISQNILPASETTTRILGWTNNLLDAPLMLYFLTSFSSSAKRNKQLLMTIVLFMAFEAVMLSIFGFSRHALRIILGVDTVVVLLISFVFFLRNVRLAITHPKSLGKAVMASSVVLFYSIFSLIYLFYYVLQTNIQDTQLVYGIIMLGSALTMTVGVTIESKRIKKLDELKTTRRELAVIYGKGRPAGLDKPGFSVKMF
jgi:hypothetical protein